MIARDDGTSDFHALRSRRRGSEAVVYAFNLIEHDDDDLRGLPLIERNRRLGLLGRARRRAIRYWRGTPQRHRALAPVHCLLSRRNSSIASCASSRSHFFLSVHRLNQSLLPFLGICNEDLVELMLDPRINP